MATKDEETEEPSDNSHISEDIQKNLSKFI